MSKAVWVSRLGKLIVVSAFLLTATVAFSQRPGVRFEYAVINGAYAPYPGEGPSAISGAVNICYLRATGCENEEVRFDLNLSKFVQDTKLENNSRARALAQNAATQSAYSRAIAKLGNDGWEIVGTPDLNFDLYFSDSQGGQAVKESRRTEPGPIWFKRQRQ